MANSASSEQSILWRRIDVPGIEWCRFERRSLQGQALVLLEGRPWAVSYSVGFDAGWRTLGAQVLVEGERSLRSLVLRADGRGRWFAGGRELRRARGLLDVDLGVTPSTNTLPLRRLRLAVGEAAELTAVWVRFPGLEVRPLFQRYTRLGARTYRYQSLVDGKVRFSARLEVDAQGRVERYAGLFDRVG